MSTYTTTWTYETSKQSEARLKRADSTYPRTWVPWSHRLYAVPHIRLNGGYVAKRQMNTLIIAKIIEDIGPGSMTSDIQFDNAVPVVAIHFSNLASINVIRKWLDAMEKSVTPTWQYKDGD